MLSCRTNDDEFACLKNCLHDVSMSRDGRFGFGGKYQTYDNTFPVNSVFALTRKLSLFEDHLMILSRDSSSHMLLFTCQHAAQTRRMRPGNQLTCRV